MSALDMVFDEFAKMCQKGFVLIGIFILSFRSFGQSDHDTLFVFNTHPDKSWIVGFETAGVIASSRDTTTWKMKRASLIRWEPHITYFLRKNLGLGFTGKIEHFQSNFLPDEPTLLEFGVLARVFMPVWFNHPVWSRLRLSVSPSFSKSNYYYTDRRLNSNYLGDFTQNVFRVPLILSLQLFKGFNLRFSYRYTNFVKRHDQFEFSFGFEYQFLKRAGAC